MMILIENQKFIKEVRAFLLAKLYEKNRYEFNRETANIFLEGALMIFKDKGFMEHLQECIVAYSSLDKKDSMEVVHALEAIENVLDMEE